MLSMTKCRNVKLSHDLHFLDANVYKIWRFKIKTTK